MRYPRGTSLGVTMDAEPVTLPIGKGEMLRDGTDVAIFAIGVTVWQAVKAAERLEQEGISAAVVNARFVKPIDAELIGAVAERVRCLVTVEEAAKTGGFGSAVLETLSDLGIADVPTKLIGLPDWFIEQGPQDLLREKYGLTAEGIYQSVKSLLAQVASGAIVGRERSGSAGAVRVHAKGMGFEPEGDEQGS